jgi:hypothetical protein
MDCKSFRDNHCTFVDDMLSGVESVAMYKHMADCCKCAAHDAKVRRALMLARSLPPIDVSSSFAESLDKRLRDIRGCSRSAHIDPANRFGVATLMASVLLLGYIGTTLYQSDMQRDIVLDPMMAIASAPQVEAGNDLTAPALLVSVSSGLPLWSAALLAEQTQGRFAQSTSRLISLSPR